MVSSISPIDNLISLQANITHPKTLEMIMHHFNGEKVDFVCSNGAPEIKGLYDIDECIEAQLILLPIN